MIYAGSRSGIAFEGEQIRGFPFDLCDESSIAAAAEMMRADPPEWVIVATGVLTLADGTGPERTYKRLDPAAMAQVFALNTIGPALIGKHMLPLMPRSERFVFAGDSPNDSPMFGYFPNAVGMANVVDFTGRLAHQPERRRCNAGLVWRRVHLRFTTRPTRNATPAAIPTAVHGWSCTQLSVACAAALVWATARCSM